MTSKKFDIQSIDPYLYPNSISIAINKYLIKLAWIGYKLYALPRTLSEFLGFGEW